ncbi:hypothetical protein AX16_005014 [Volvariella volvacea WC 439]|nr:hypothetical protein AX16_005014 [Volvariella volvacea WC 439]
MQFRALSLLALSFAATVLASPTKRFDGITVELSAPSSSVASIDDLTLTATVTNTGSETVRVLKYGTILDENLPTNSFEVTKDGQVVPFTGVRIHVSLEDLDDTSFATIPAGESVIVKHSIASLYDFASVGTGKFTFQPNTNFQVIGANDRVASPELTKVESTASSIDVEITADVAQRQLQELNKRAVNICSDSSRRAFIDASYTEAKSLASGATSYINSRGASDSLYRAYWGANSVSTITSVFNGVANENSSSRTLSCVDSYGVCGGGVIAYTVIATTNIYYCSIFFNQVPSSQLCGGTTVAARNVRGGTTLHEITHAVSRTTDVVYGCAADQALSDSQKRVNADNYNCFATQVYANTRC